MARKSLKWKSIAAVLSVVMTVSLGSFSAMADPNDSQTSSVTESTASVADSTPSVGEETENQDETVGTQSEKEASSSAAESGTESTKETDSDTSSKPASVSENEEKPVRKIAMYRLYNPNSGEHFYTGAKKEAILTRNAGWNYEGIGWYATSTGKPVYRVYNPNAGDHHYTMNVREKNYLIEHGWKDEGVRFYSSEKEEVKLTRQYNPNATSGSHNYTTSPKEAAYLVKIGWRDEGTAWYAAAGGRRAKVSDLGATTYYQGKDYSEIYDFEYYINHNNLASKYANDDQGAIKYFVEHGLFDKQQAKEGVSTSSAIYKKYRTSSDAYIKYVREHSDKNLVFANQYSSNTNYLITVNRNTHMVYVYQGSQGNWKRINSFACGDGARSTPTVEGKFSIYGHKYYFDSGSVRCFYASMFHGAYYFHSTLYAQTKNPQTEVDGRVGMALSHGCVRLKLQNAKWIYNSIPTGTAVVVSRW